MGMRKRLTASLRCFCFTRVAAMASVAWQTIFILLVVCRPSLAIETSHRTTIPGTVDAPDQESVSSSPDAPVDPTQLEPLGATPGNSLSSESATGLDQSQTGTDDELNEKSASQRDTQAAWVSKYYESRAPSIFQPLTGWSPADGSFGDLGAHWNPPTLGSVGLLSPRNLYGTQPWKKFDSNEYIKSSTLGTLAYGGNFYAGSAYFGSSPNMMVGSLHPGVLNEVMMTPGLANTYLRSPRFTQMNEMLVKPPWPFSGSVG